MAVNLAITSRDKPPVWVMAEYDRRRLSRDARTLTVGSTQLRRTGAGLELDVLEQSSPFPRPFPRRVEGTIRFEGEAGAGAPLLLDERGAHQWWPVAPRGRVDVRFDELGVRFSGEAYHDSNRGSEPLGAAFRSWSWGRFHGRRSTLISYDASLSTGGETSLLLGLSGGRFAPIDVHTTAHRSLLPTAWGLSHRVRADRGAPAPSRRRTLLDAPFYARHVVDTTLAGERVTGITEALSLERFASPWVRFLLPFRMRRS